MKYPLGDASVELKIDARERPSSYYQGVSGSRCRVNSCTGSSSAATVIICFGAKEPVHPPV